MVPSFSIIHFDLIMPFPLIFFASSDHIAPAYVASSSENVRSKPTNSDFALTMSLLLQKVFALC
jgi:hypothetical protein